MAKQGRAAILVKEKRLRLTSPPPPASIWPTAVGGARRLRRGGNRGRTCACALGSWRMGAGRKALARGRIDALTQSAHTRGGARVCGRIRGAVGRLVLRCVRGEYLGVGLRRLWGASCGPTQRGGGRLEAVVGSGRWSVRSGGDAGGATRTVWGRGGRPGVLGPPQISPIPPALFPLSRPLPCPSGPYRVPAPVPRALALAEAAGCVPDEPEWPFSPGGSYVGRGQ